MRDLFRKRYLLPSEHGAWTWWSGPLLIGLAAARCPGWDSVILTVAACASFLLHQPASVAVKVLAGRRPRGNLGPALFWVLVYAAIALAAVAALFCSGHHKFVWLIVVGLPFFAWHLFLIYRKSERRQMAHQMVGTGVLALWAPAAFWVGGGKQYPEPWVLWLLVWFQSMGAVANVYLHLEQKGWTSCVPLRQRLRAGSRTLGLHGVACMLAILFVAADFVPQATLLAFSITLIAAVDGVIRTLAGARPRTIGIRQLVVTTLFVAVMLAAYLLRP
jgi:hypothetical protein